MRVSLFNWHTGYAYMLAKALPDIEFYVLPTPYNRDGWDKTQRPKPGNVRCDDQGVAKLGRGRAGWSIASLAFADVVLVQTSMDLDFLMRMRSDRPTLYLSHNHADLDGTPPERIEKLCRRLVTISPMKRDSWYAAGAVGAVSFTSIGGYSPPPAPITVIPPGIDRDEYADGKWTGRGGYLLTVCNGLSRPLFDLDGWLRATERFPVDMVRLVGSHNEGIRGAVGLASSWEALKAEYRGCTGYLNPTRPPYEDPHNLAALEAAACGAPVRNLHGEPPRVEDFPIEAFRENWRRVLSEVVSGQH